MRASLPIAAAAIQPILGSVNCTTTAPVSTHCCPFASSEVVKISPPGSLLMLGCAVDRRNKLWYWNYNGLYTPYTKSLAGCTVNGVPHDPRNLPDCSNATDVLIAAGSPPPRCDPHCDSNGNLPDKTYFGDKQRESNIALDLDWWSVEGEEEEGEQYEGEGEEEYKEEEQEQEQEITFLEEPKRFPHAVHRLRYDGDEVEE